MASKTWTESEIKALIEKSDVAAQRAVCAIYKRQTVDERASAETRWLNGVGFSASDAKIGSRLARWMLAGTGEFTRPVDGQTFRGGLYMSRLAICRALALKYAKQLAEIANARETAKAAQAA